MKKERSRLGPSSAPLGVKLFAYGGTFLLLAGTVGYALLLAFGS